MNKLFMVGVLTVFLASNFSFAAGTGTVSKKDRVQQHKQSVQQLKDATKQKKTGVKTNFEMTKKEHKDAKGSAQSQLNALLKTLDKDVLVAVREQLRLMKQEIQTVRGQNQSTSGTVASGSVSTGGFLQNYDQIKAIKDKYDAKIKALLPADMQAKYQELIDKIASLNNSYGLKIQEKKDELMEVRTDSFDKKTQLLASRFETIIKPTLEKLKANDPEAYQAYVTKLQTMANDRIQEITAKTNISQASKQTQINVYKAILSSLEVTTAVIEQEATATEVPVEAAVQ